MDSSGETRIYSAITLVIWFGVIFVAFGWSGRSTQGVVQFVPWVLLLAEILYAGCSIIVRQECRKSELAGEALVRVWRWVSLTLVVLLLMVGFLAKNLNIG